MTAGKIAADVRSGRRPASEIVAVALERAAQDETNSFISLDEAAMARAGEIDSIVSAGGDPGPLGGVPVAIKDLIDHEGRITTAGSGFYRKVADESAYVVQLLEEAGAIIIGRANLHEFAFGFDSENEWFGAVRNPWDLDTSAGGSSGGSATAVASGLVPLSLGTDTGGSVRIPAAMTGIFGLKVTHGAISTRGVFPLVPSCDTVGPFATSTADLALAHRVLAVHDPHDPHSRKRPQQEIRPIERLGVPRPWVDDAPVTAAVAADFAHALTVLEDNGLEIVDIEIPELIPPGRIGDAIGREVAAIHRDYITGGEVYGRSVAPRIAAAMDVTPEADAEARRWRADTREATRDALTRVDALITPTVANGRKVIGEDEIDGVPARVVLSYFSAIVNHIDLPAISLPLELSDGTPPTSIQIVGDDWSEPCLLALGERLEQAGIVGFPHHRMNSR